MQRFFFFSITFVMKVINKSDKTEQDDRWKLNNGEQEDDCA